MRALTLTILILICAPAMAAADNADAVTGIWLDANKEGYIQIHATSAGEYVGRIVGSTDGEVRNDTENPDPDKRGRSLLGARILHGFTYNPDNGRWEDGRIYDPDNGKTYDAWMAMTEDGRLEVHGYIGFSMIGRSQKWTRAEADDPGVMKEALVGSD